MILISALGTAWLAIILWQNDSGQSGMANQVVIRSGGKIFSSVSLSRDQVIAVPGPLGITQVVVRNLQARVTSDPGPRQYCVQQGWLKQAGEIALCLPNQVSVELSDGKSSYDSLNY